MSVPNNLRSFLEDLERAGELVRVREPVAAKLEIAELADRAMKSPGGGPALFFERPVPASPCRRVPVSARTLPRAREVARKRRPALDWRP